MDNLLKIDPLPYAEEEKKSVNKPFKFTITVTDGLDNNQKSALMGKFNDILFNDFEFSKRFDQCSVKAFWKKCEIFINLTPNPVFDSAFSNNEIVLNYILGLKNRIFDLGDEILDVKWDWVENV